MDQSGRSVSGLYLIFMSEKQFHEKDLQVSEDNRLNISQQYVWREDVKRSMTPPGVAQWKDKM